jgi:hypothetical protein
MYVSVTALDEGEIAWHYIQRLKKVRRAQTKTCTQYYKTTRHSFVTKSRKLIKYMFTSISRHKIYSSSYDHIYWLLHH